MMQDEKSITQNLRDAGCGTEAIETIIGCWRRGDLTQMKKQIALCRREQLERMHEKQKCIDRLDYLCYRLENEKKGESI